MNCQKHLFSLSQDTHYLNNAYKAPLLRSAEDACLKALNRDRNPQGISIPDFFNEPAEIRKQFARLINTTENRVAIIPSTSYGFRSAFANIKGKPNGKALITEDEFPSGYYALKRWCSEQSNQLVSVDRPSNGNMADWNQNLLNQITDQTSVVLLSVVHWMTGSKFDLKAISARCRAVGAKLIVDGTQSIGACSFDVQSIPVDALICAGYKWLLGPYSVGVAYMNESFDHGQPIEDCWLNKANADQFQRLTNYEDGYPVGAVRYSVGEASNFLLAPILRAGLTQLNEWGVDNMEQYCGRLIAPLLDFLEDTPIERTADPYFSNHLFGLKLPAGIDLKQMKQTLAQEQIYVSLRGDYLRVSVNVYNDSEDVTALINVLNQVV